MNNVNLQGLYQFGTKVIYLAWEPANEHFMFKDLFIGTPVGSYSSMKYFAAPPQLFFTRLNLLHLGWLSTDTIPSDLYPELFI